MAKWTVDYVTVDKSGWQSMSGIVSDTAEGAIEYVKAHKFGTYKYQCFRDDEEDNNGKDN